MSELKRPIFIICEESKSVSNFLIFTLECEYHFKVLPVANLQGVIDLVNDPTALEKSLVDYLPTKIAGEEAPQLNGVIIGGGFCTPPEVEKVVTALKEKQLSIPVICLLGDEFKGNFPDFSYNKLRSLKYIEDEFLEKFTGIIGDFFVKVSTTDEFASISLDPLAHFTGISEDIFIKLVTGRLLKIFSTGDKIEREDIDRFHKKGVKELYMKKEAAMWILKVMNENFAAILEDHIGGIEFAKNFSFSKFSDQQKLDEEMEELTPPEPEEEVIDEASEESFDKSEFDVNDLGEENLVSNSEEENTESSEVESEEDDGVRFTVNQPFELERKLIKELHKKKNELINRLKKLKSLNGFLKNTNIDREATAYFKTRTELVCNIACGVARDMEWASEAALEKLVYIAHLHDLALMSHPHLAKIQTKEELMRMDKLSDQEKNLVLEHPMMAINLIKEDALMPADTDTIISQHHERANGVGFPKALPTNRILPFAALTSVSINLAQYIIDNPEWKFEEYKKIAKPEFTGGNFSKIFLALEKVMTKK